MSVAAGRETVHAAFARAQAERRLALIPYLTAGFPSRAATAGLIAAAERGGADIIELGIPFSDPLADGPTIQAASQRALAAGAGVSSALESAAQATRPALLMTYYNPLLSRGLERFAADASAAGVAGVIVPDLPPEEGEELHRRLREQGLGMSYLIAPTSSPERIEIACRASDLFIYVVSLMGTTGARSALSERVAPLLAEARRHTSLPLVVGFGISGPEQVEGLRGLADGFIVGSALVDRVGAAGANAAAAVEAFVTELREAC